MTSYAAVMECASGKLVVRIKPSGKLAYWDGDKFIVLDEPVTPTDFCNKKEDGKDDK